MRIALLGATSQIATDLTGLFLSENAHRLALFARRPEAIAAGQNPLAISRGVSLHAFEEFTPDIQFDAVINCVGAGNPAAAVSMGAHILEVTQQFDAMVLAYLKHHAGCRYIFLSSGAAYGTDFSFPADADTKASIPINHLGEQDWYGIAKTYAECRHRSLAQYSIVDIRIFSYFSEAQDPSRPFLMSNIVRAIQSGQELLASDENIVRDYIGPDDLFQLISLILTGAPTNIAVDCYTKNPIDKHTLFQNMQQRFGLAYRITSDAAGVNATGNKMNYFSKNRIAKKFGYAPSRDSLMTITDIVSKILSKTDGPHAK